MLVPLIVVPPLIALGVIIKIADSKSKARERRRVEERNAGLEQQVAPEDW